MSSVPSAASSPPSSIVDRPEIRPSRQRKFPTKYADYTGLPLHMVNLSSTSDSNIKLSQNAVISGDSTAASSSSSTNPSIIEPQHYK